MDELTQIPESFAAGTTVTYRASLSVLGYSAADGWALTVYIAGPSVIEDGAAGVADGDSFVVTIPATDTADLTPGTYAWVERVSKSGEEFDARSGVTAVTPNLAVAAAGDLTSFDETQLAAVRARISDRLAKDVSRMSAFDRAIEREALKDLREIEADLLARIAARRRGGIQRQSIRAAFTRP